MDLIFRHNGKLRQGAQLNQILINDVYDRMVMIDPDSDEMFLVSADSIGTCSVSTLIGSPKS